MRNLIVAVVLLALLIVGLGIYRGWFTVSKHSEGTTTDVNVRIDKERIEHDVDAAVEEVKKTANETLSETP